jgi:hypothetical protein
MQEEMQAGSPNRGAMIALAVLALVVVALVFYFVGRVSANAEGAEAQGFQEGRETEASRYKPGKPGYQRIYRAGYQAGLKAGRASGLRTGEREGAETGRKVGFTRGEEIGQLEGEREGIALGARAALGNVTDWETGTYYIVKLEPGEQGVPYRVQVRKETETDERYAICADNPADMCSKPISRR